MYSIQSLFIKGFTMDTYHAAYWSSDPSRLSSSDEEEDGRDNKITLHTMHGQVINVNDAVELRMDQNIGINA